MYFGGDSILSWGVCDAAGLFMELATIYFIFFSISLKLAAETTEQKKLEYDENGSDYQKFWQVIIGSVVKL